ncbi:MAG: hypothetical protein WCC63_01520 [Candidatus Bathyarchaeia archaeon]
MGKPSCRLTTILKTPGNTASANSQAPQTANIIEVYKPINDPVTFCSWTSFYACLKLVLGAEISR